MSLISLLAPLQTIIVMLPLNTLTGNGHSVSGRMYIVVTSRSLPFRYPSLIFT